MRPPRLLAALAVVLTLGSSQLWAWPVPAPHPIARPFIAPETPYTAGHRGLDIRADAGVEDAGESAVSDSDDLVPGVVLVETALRAGAASTLPITAARRTGPP